MSSHLYNKISKHNCLSKSFTSLQTKFDISVVAEKYLEEPRS